MTGAIDRLCQQAPDESHCDHMVSPHSHPMIEHDETFQCCYCGRKRTVHIAPQTGGTSYVSKAHGKYAPQVRVIY